MRDGEHEPEEHGQPSAPELVFFVREAFPSVATGVSLTEGIISGTNILGITSEMNDGGVIFGDGIEEDRIQFDFGRRATLRMAETRLRLLKRA